MTEPGLPFTHRARRYLGERFPPLRHGLLIGAFSTSAVCLSALVRAPTALPSPASLGVGFGVLFLLFLQLRIADEHKDFEDDRRYRPERAVPRGLISLRELRRLGAAAAIVQLALTASLGAPMLLVLLALIWAWMALMAVEFFAPHWLKARPVLYLLSHMIVMPLFALFAIACERPEGLPAGERAAGITALATFLALAFVNGVVLEVARKCWAVESEREGVETYSRLWGHRAAGRTVTVAIVIGLVLAVTVSRLSMAGTLVLVPVVAISLFAAACSEHYVREPKPSAASAMELGAGLVVLVHYIALGPLALGIRAWLP
jgi:hypothetical protein